MPPLSAPDPGRTPTVGELEGYESVRLFVERGRNRASGFALTPENARAIAGVCRRLEGIPLAIELAAARVGVLSVGQISERLKDPLKFLRAGNRTASRGSRRSGAPWTGATSCSASPSRSYFESFRFSRAASRSKRPRR